MDYSTALMSLLGGSMIGAAAAALLYLNGKVLGVSGIVTALLSGGRREGPWRAAFVGGLLSGGALLLLLYPQALAVLSPAGAVGCLAAGLLVGYGTSMGRGCTSGHGVCGISRLSRRSIIATVIFMASAMVTVYVTHHLVAGAAWPAS